MFDLTSTRPTLYVASAAGASVARVLERVSAVDPAVRVVDSHPLGAHDPNGLDIFYLMLVATIVGLVTTGRGNPYLRGSITGAGTFLGGILHALPFLIPEYRTT